MTLRHVLALPAAVAALAGCTGTETGNPGAEISTGSIRAYSTLPEQYAVAPDTGPVVVDGLWLVMDAIELTSCGGETLNLLDEPGPVDLVDGLVNLRTLPEDEYCEGRIVLTSVAEGAAGVPPALEQPFLMTGTRADGLRIEVAGDPDGLAPLPFEPFAVGPEPFSLLLAVDVAPVLQDIDLGLEPADPDGIVRIDRTFAGERPIVFQETLTESVSLFRDADQDGVLDDSERDAL